MPAPSQITEDDPRGIFGKIYNFEDWQLAKDEEIRRKEEEKQQKLNLMGEKYAGLVDGRPAHWPPDTMPDPGNWVAWVPDGWGQGIKTTDTGKPLKCWIGPPGSDPKTGYGKRYFHRKTMEEYCGYTFSNEKPVKEEEKEKTVKSCHDELPNWPGEGGNKDDKWLPQDWCIFLRQLPTGTHRCYMPPGAKDGFLWHRACVEQWLQGNQKNLSQIEGSRKMQDKMATAREKGTSRWGEDGLMLPKAKIRKRSGAHDTRATEESYARCPRLAACQAAALEEAGCPTGEGAALKKRADLCREMLEKRGFEDVDFMTVFLRAEAERGDEGADAGEGARPYDKVVARLVGVFYAMPPGATGERCYQQVVEAPETNAGVFSTGLYLFESSSRSAWKLSGSLDDSRAGYAVFPCESEDRGTTLVASEAKAWRVLKKDFFFPPSEHAAVA